MNAIGGYFELACGHSTLYHPSGVLLNSARNALRLIVRTYGIDHLFVPEYTCPVVYEALRKEMCAFTRYSLNAKMMPAQEFPADAFILYTNYFGVMGQAVEELALRYPKLIVDNAQAFYSKPCGLATFYSPRKFFGLPDGGIVIGKGMTEEGLPDSVSYSRCAHLLKRHDLGASAGYADFKRNSILLSQEPIPRMSRLTHALLGSCDTTRDMVVRKRNFAFLHAKLCSTFPFAMAQEDVPLAYPYVTQNPALRAWLISNNHVFVAQYWPGLEDSVQKLVHGILPLPLDSRYCEREMEQMVRLIEAFNKEA